MKSVEMTIKLRNNLLKERRTQLGLTSRKMAEAIGIHWLDYSMYENMRKSPIGRSAKGVTRWKPSAVKIADYHCCRPEELWPEALLAIKQPEVATKVDAEDVAMVASLAASAEPVLLPDVVLEAEDQAHMLRDAMSALSPREADVVRRHFGLDGAEEETLEDIGADLGVSRERTRQIQLRACSKLRDHLKDDLA